MAEWSNATDLRSVSPGSAGSNPAGDTIALLAQSVEHQTFNLRVAGSSPARGLFISDSIVVSIAACHAADQGSIPCRRDRRWVRR